MADSNRPGKGNRVFVSSVSGEFEHASAAFPGLRSRLRHHLTAADCEVKVQEDFRQTSGGTLAKLDAYIRSCDAVIHLVGELPGHLADADSAQDVPDYLLQFASEHGGRSFLDRQPELLAEFGDGTGISLTQFEAYMALHHEVPLFVYASPEAEAGQQAHLRRLRKARPSRHARPFRNAGDLFGQLIGDLREIIPALRSAEQRIAPTRLVARHTAADFLGREDELKLLDDAWGADRTHLLALIAWGGVGKTALLAHWVQTRFVENAWKDAQDQPDPLSYFDWTFYDQGTRSDDDTRAGVAHVDSFFAAALEFFGDEDPTKPGKGARLARLVQAQRCLLVLDGVEPLQYPFHHPQAGQFTDPDLRELLVGLAQRNPGLCLVSSRLRLSDLSGVAGTAPQQDLGELPLEVAVRLLRRLGVIGSNADMESAARDYDGHALTLTLLGRFLTAARGGDIRQRDTLRLEKANDLRSAQTRNAWHVLEAYERWLDSPQGRPEDVQALRLTGLFDRPATPDCLAALRAAPAIRGLTEHLVPLDRDAWNALLLRLHEAQLVELRFPAADSPHAPRPEPRSVPVDVHPLAREYFGRRLRELHPEGFREAHSRLFDHLCASTEHRPDTLAGLQPLYQAVSHGCLAGRQQEAYLSVYVDRIQRRKVGFSSKKLGAAGALLGAVAAFFDEPWIHVSPQLSKVMQGSMLNEAGYYLRALGRPVEAVEPFRLAAKMMEVEGDRARRLAAILYGNLSELEVTLGRLEEAVRHGRSAVELADRSGDPFMRMTRRACTAEAMHQAGAREKARELFDEAEAMQAQRDSAFPMLYSQGGFLYSGLLLAPAERAAWKHVDLRSACSPVSALGQEIRDCCAQVEGRTLYAMPIAEKHDWLIDIACDHLTLARAALYRSLSLGPEQSDSEKMSEEVESALVKLRAANALHLFPLALLTAAFFHATLGDNPDKSKRLLDEAQQIAERGPMPLYLADVHLHRARLFRDLSELKKARDLIEKHGYWRRREELEDAEAAATAWQ
jgi:tetratricopeptide (TPR) repeat protein